MEWIREEIRGSGCEPEGLEAEGKPGKPARIPEADINHKNPKSNREAPKPDFGPPPRTSKKIYCVSYAWTDDSSGFVDQLCVDAKKNGIEIVRDKTHLDMGERITKFMDRLAQGDRIFVILSEKYLKSPFCMYELCEIWNESRKRGGDFLERVRVFQLPDVDIASIVARGRITLHWRTEFREVDAFIKENGADLLGVEDLIRFKKMQEFYLHVGPILNLVVDTLQPQTLEELEAFSFEEDS